MATGRSRRIAKQIEELRKSVNDPEGAKFIVDETSEDESSNLIVGRICPRSNIFNQAAFRIEIRLPPEYPFQPPQIKFLTPIYHPNVDEQGKISLEILNSNEKHRPNTPLTDYVNAVVAMIDQPDFDYPLRSGKILQRFSFRFVNSSLLDLAVEYHENRAEFDRQALEMIRAHGLPRQWGQIFLFLSNK